MTLYKYFQSTLVTLLLLLITVTGNLQAQTIGLSCGLNRNRFFDTNREDNPHFSTNYTPGNGYSFALSISDLHPDTIMPFRFSLLFDHYKGHLFTTSGGLGGYSNTEAGVERSVISLAVYPVNFTFLKHIELSAGVAASLKVNDITSGYRDSRVGSQQYYMTLENDSVQINNPFTWGATARIAYVFNTGHQWSVVPEYNFFIGLSDDLKNCNANIRSMRHSLQVAICRKIK